MAGALVVGGAGFIGMHLLEDLRRRGLGPVVSLDITGSRRAVDGVRYAHADVRRPLDLDLDLDGVDVVYNLAGLVTTPGHPAADYYETAIAGALSVCRLATEHRINRILFTSTMSVYPTGEELKDESFPPAPVNAYGASKLLAEQVHEQWLDADPDRSLVIARPAVVFGPGERGNFLRLWNLMRRGAFVYPGRRDTIKACGYVTDLVDSFHFALSLAERRVLYNFAYEERLTIEDICRMVSWELGRPEPRRTFPLGVARAAAAPFEALEQVGLRTGINRARIDKLVESTNIHPEFLVKRGFRFNTTPPEGIARWAHSLRPGS